MYFCTETKKCMCIALQNVISETQTYSGTNLEYDIITMGVVLYASLPRCNTAELDGNQINNEFAHILIMYLQLLLRQDMQYRSLACYRVTRYENQPVSLYDVFVHILQLYITSPRFRRYAAGNYYVSIMLAVLYNSFCVAMHLALALEGSAVKFYKLG